VVAAVNLNSSYLKKVTKKPMLANIEINLIILNLNLNNATKPSTASHTANQSGLKLTVCIRYENTHHKKTKLNSK
jgi:hypothetical protein